MDTERTGVYRRNVYGEIYLGETFERIFFCGRVSQGGIFCAVVFREGVLRRGNIWTPLYKCGWFICSGRLDHLVKCACWKGVIKLAWSICQLISLNLGRGLSIFGWNLCINELKFTHSFQKTLLVVTELYWWQFFTSRNVPSKEKSKCGSLTLLKQFFSILYRDISIFKIMNYPCLGVQGIVDKRS